MRGRHKKASGGGVAPKEVYAGKGSNVVKEAEERKRGGRMKPMKMEGEKAKHRLDRPGRKRGGRIGADMAPLSSAARTTKLSEEAGGGA